MTEYRAARLQDLQQDTPTEVKLADRKVLLVRQGDSVHALAATCPHRGVPLSKGAVDGQKLVCPAHRAIFDLNTGEVMAPPACENLARYEVRIQDGSVFVLLPEEGVDHPLPKMARRGRDDRRFVIVGAGAAGWRAAETLRREGFEGQIVVLSDEPHGPLDRVELSKSYLKPAQTPDVPLVRADAKRQDMDIELRNVEVATLDKARAEVVLRHSHERIAYDRLLVATGSIARPLHVDGADLPGIHTLRSLADAKSLRADLATCLDKGQCRVTIVGGGFIGLEVATVLSGRDDVDVTVVLREIQPLESLFGPDAARRVAAEHREAGVRLVPSAQVTGFTGLERVQKVELDTGDTIETDLVLVAIGAEPRTDWLPLEREPDGGIAVNPDLSVPGLAEVFLAGDIAQVPTPWGSVRIEHWRFAQETGELAARNMLGQARTYQGTPFFWTMQQAAGSYSYTGHAETWDDILGSADGSKFSLHYVRDNMTSAILALGFDDEVTLAERRMAGTGPVPRDRMSLRA